MRRPALAAVGLLALVLSGCAGSPSAEATLRVYAAASLQGAFDELVAEFAARHPEIVVEPVVYDGSSTLATQIVEGAPADVFASADERTMAVVVDGGYGGEPVVFATNTPVLIVPEGNPAGISEPADLVAPGVSFVRCADDVPCGSAARALLERAGVEVTPVSVEQNVTAVLTKVAAGEADAGVVYLTDAAAEERVEAIAPAGVAEVVNRYPIVALEAGDAAGESFVAFVLSDEGRSVLESAGFGAP
ncbi:molybdate ABC transporter substrate-binding protein [Microbacterium aquimaris]|uniref:Molybdate ABC transporter substrate-binding protein n=1 Tax=Microbacterium aquimaris TaxID=459816 RepID=A0ABU5N9M3_9MICO|nr:molybdate ABC transporter substrate-binding protein [Microbacterium aquimaris]MDZ8162788.1 molybdate ABC transporter substrate-binding protein [Microbacterium aquimaris]